MKVKAENEVFHKRVPIPKLNPQSRLQRYKNLRTDTKIFESFVSRLYKVGKKLQISRWAAYRFAMGMLRLKYALFNRIEIRGEEMIPEEGAIFLVNHIGTQDVELFLSVFSKPVSVFTAVGDSWITDFLEYKYYFIPRRGTRELMVEKMIQNLLHKNRYLAIWPEGTYARHGKIMEGFSGIVRVYATINAKKNRIPFVPVLLQGSDCYGKWGRKSPFGKIIVNYLPPVYLPRKWLSSKTKGGKTPREIINFLMNIMAKANGQISFEPNPLLERRRGRHRRKQW